MATRREFMAASAAAAAAIAARPLYAWQGANNKIRMGVIGCGNRAGRVFNSLSRHDDCVFVAGAEVNEARLAGFMTPARQSFNLAMVKDYRRLLERQDIDAVLIGTPDFSHAKIMVDALAAGKDVYVEKPISNNIARINTMLDAYNKTNLVVQVGNAAAKLGSLHRSQEAPGHGDARPGHPCLIQQGGNYAPGSRTRRRVPPGTRLGRLAGRRAEEAVQAGLPSFRALVGVRQRPGRRLGRASRRRRQLVHERRHQAAAQDRGGRLHTRTRRRS